MNTSNDTTVRINRESLQRLRVIAAKRGTSHGVLLNDILADKDALSAAISVLDAKTEPADNGKVTFHARENVKVK